MTKRADAKARSRRRATARGQENAIQAAAPPRKITAASDQPRAHTGLQWLFKKGRITPRQRLAGEVYGQRVRIAQMDGAETLRSCLEIIDRVDGGSAGGIPASQTETMAWLIQGKAELAEARQALVHPRMINVCDLVCGQGQAPREISPNQREADEIETTLKLALDLLILHFEEVGLIGGKARSTAVAP